MVVGEGELYWQELLTRDKVIEDPNRSLTILNTAAGLRFLRHPIFGLAHFNSPIRKRE
jgi:hypothetical protein